MAGVLRSTQLVQRLTQRAGRSAFQQTQSRGFAADHHGPPKVNFWEEPSNPANWKAEQTVLLILGGWAVVIKGATSYFGK